MTVVDPEEAVEELDLTKHEVRFISTQIQLKSLLSPVKLYCLLLLFELC